MTPSVETPTKEDLIEGYRAAIDQLPPEAMELGFRLTVRTIQALAQGRPIAPAELVDVWGLPSEQVGALLETSVRAGQAEVNAEGDLVGGVLTLEPTDHEIIFGDTTVYAWCALDAIWAPAVVGKTARIRSTDPVTGGTIDLTVSPRGVEAVRPDRAVVTVVGPDAATDGGRQSQRCTHMLFFESRGSARAWAEDAPGLAILAPAEAHEVAVASVVEPARRVGLI
ncbi:MAG TPA: organomercurial lyase [Gemmatimonadales bacterium]|nr:organomercurial lyase [Gemmatimonadales bacterium]